MSKISSTRHCTTNRRAKACWTFSLLGVLTVLTPVNLTAQERALVSGIETENISPTLAASDDFYEYVNAKWLAETEIPAALSNYGTFTALDELTKKQVLDIIEKASHDPNASGPAKQVGNFYNSYINVARRNELGIKPVQPLLDIVSKVSDKEEWIDATAKLNRVGVGSVYNFSINPDEKNTDQYAIYLNQSGTSLPDRDYYLKDDDQYVAARAALLSYVTELLKIAGHGEDAAAVAKKILAFETELAKAQWTNVQMRDPIASYNKVTVDAFASAHPALRWPQYCKIVDLPTSGDLIVGQPSFMDGAQTAVSDTDLATLKAYMQVRILDTYGESLDDTLEKLHFQFHGVALSGISEQDELWKRGVEACNGLLGMPVGQLYVAAHFSPAAKARMSELVENLKKSFAVRIQKLDWMGQGTKKRATEKLQMITTKIGYPDVWKDYSSVKIVPDNLVANILAIAEFEHAYETAKLGKPVDRKEWHMVPQQVNAYYNPSTNEIGFPAAILQPPFFNMAADDAVNYGGIGAVIGHEISHAFDDQGSQYDGHGNLQNWWTEHDREEFEKRTKQLVDQYAGYMPFNDASLDGKLTLGENIGDLGGMSAAFTAYEISLDGKKAPVIDNLTGPQRFFMSWAQVWRRKYTEKELRKRLLTDPHSPSHYRTNGIVGNMDPFYDAFGIKPDSKMFIAPDKRVRIW